MIYRSVSEIFKSHFSWRKKLRYLAAEVKQLGRKRSRPPKRRKANNRRRNRGYAITEMGELSDSVFKLMFRIDRPSFEYLASRLKNSLDRNELLATNSSGSPVTVTTRLAVTLRWLAGGSYLDICFGWGIGHSTFFSDRGVLWPTIEALNELFVIGVPIHDDDALQELSDGFARQSNNILTGCIMAMDGIAIKTRAPYKWEVPRVTDYRNRKGGFGIVVLAGCDINCKFIFAVTNHCGSTNDVIAWRDSSLYHAIEEGLLPSNFFIIGDEAFPTTNQCLSPWPGRGLGLAKDAFNYWLSNSRQCIERAFGILTKRWGILWRRFHFSFDRWALVMQVCMKLHNYCVDNNDSPPPRRFNEDMRRGDRWAVYHNRHDDDDVLRSRANGDRRRNITDELESRGIVRPPHAQVNSRALA